MSRLLRHTLEEATPARALMAPLKIPTAVDEITDRLITTIALGEILPGARLPAEREIAAMLRISRTTVREAIGRLSAIGLVEIRRGRNGGAYVRTSWTEASASAVQRTLLPRWEELEQLFDLCALVEATVARTAAERRTDDDVRRILAAHAEFAAAEGYVDEQRTDHIFHQAIMDAAKNPQLTSLNRDLITRISLGFPFEPWRDPELGGDGSQRALAEHADMADAITSQDIERAGQVARRHQILSADIIRQTLERAGAAAPPPSGLR